MRNQTTILPLLILLCLSHWGGLRVSADERRPNVIVFLSDDQGWGDFSFTGNPDVSTPNIDSLAHDGAFFENFYVCPVCSPTRAEFLTGRYHVRGGVSGTGAGLERLDLDETTIAEEFRAAGYETAAFGKWHNGMQAPYHPISRGFNHYYGFCSGHWGNYFDPVLELNGELVKGKGFVVDDFTNQALRFMELNQDKPFFVYFPYNTPHSPMQVPDRHWRKFANAEIEIPAPRNPNGKRADLNHTRAALAMCENIDWNVGRVLRKLEELGLEDNTIVAYFCDNGPNAARWNDGLKGRKGSTDEGGVRSPLFLRWAGHIEKGTRVEEITGAIDLMPSLMEMCEVPTLKRNKPWDGMSFASVLTGPSAGDNLVNRTLFHYWRDRVSARSSKFRLDHQGKLFDLSADRGQFKPVNSEYPDWETKLLKACETFRSQAIKELENSPRRPVTVGHESLELTQLPARDAKATGQIQRSNRFPNCSFFGNWHDPKDVIVWPVNVLNAGNYEVTLYYTLAKGDEGVELLLKGPGGELNFMVNESHTSPLKGAENDRVKRMESYVKDFRALKMGDIYLKNGVGELKLSSPLIPGDQSIEFRMLTLRSVKSSGGKQ